MESITSAFPAMAREVTFRGSFASYIKISVAFNNFSFVASGQEDKNTIRDNLEIDNLCERYPFDRELLEGIYEMVVETVLTKGDTIVIASNPYPTELVRSKFMKLHLGHVEYVMDCMKGSTSKVRNIKKYMLAALFNAPTTMSTYYKVQVNHDYPQYAVK